MADYLYPNPLEDAAGLLRLLGSFWSDTYQGNTLLASYLAGRARLDRQAHQDLAELTACLSRFRTPPEHTEGWRPLVLLESARSLSRPPRFDGSYQFNAGLTFDGPGLGSLPTWAAPTGLTGVDVITDRVQGDGLCWTAGADFYLEDRRLVFREDPFAAAPAAVEVLLTDSVVTDRRCRLWLYHSRWDTDLLDHQYGYVLGQAGPPTAAFRDLLNALFDSLAAGTTADSLRRFVAALCDSPPAAAAEVVRHLLRDDRRQWAVTDGRAYGLSLAAAPLVAEGQTLTAGDPLGDAWEFFEFNAGGAPGGIRALALGRGFLAAGYVGDLVFENTVVPLAVEEGVAGYTKVGFALGGFPGDVEKFWADTHAAGVAAGQTLAMLLDQRPAAARETQPTAAALPATINPLEFLLANCFRANLTVVRLRPESFGPAALGQGRLRLLRALVPPPSALIVLVELAAVEPPIIMDGSGETVTAFIGLEAADAVDFATAVGVERVVCRQLAGSCH